MHLFQREGDTITAHLHHTESLVLAAYLDQVRAIILGEVPANLKDRELTRRVFPPASTTDRAVAEDFAAMTASGLATDKAARMARLAELLRPGSIELTLDQAEDAVAAIADARLVTAEVCGVDSAVNALSDTEADRAVTDHQSFHEETYRILSALQVTLVDALLANDDLG